MKNNASTGHQPPPTDDSEHRATIQHHRAVVLAHAVQRGDPRPAHQAQRLRGTATPGVTKRGSR